MTHAVAAHALLLLLDGHSSHFKMDSLASDLPKNTTLLWFAYHLTQPTNVTNLTVASLVL